MKLLLHNTISYSIITTTGLSSSPTFFKAATSAEISVSPVLSSNQETTSSEGRMAANSPEAETDTGCKGRKPFVSSVILSSRGETLTAPSAFR